MIGEAVARAIVEIVDAHDEASLGTGFLIAADGSIVTAAHVIGVRDEAAVAVRFLDGTQVGAARIVRGAADWAVVVIVRVPAGISPVRWSPLESVDREEWLAIGYAQLRGNQRGGFHGRIVTADRARLAGYCPELVGATYADACGLSGAPWVVGGEVAAVIVEVLYRTDPVKSIVAGHVEAIPLTAIAAELGTLGDEARELPWQPRFAAAIDTLPRPMRCIAAAAAQIADPVDGTRLPRRVARHMIRGELACTVEVVVAVGRRFDDATVDELIGLARTLWVREDSASHLAALVCASQPAVLATELDWSAKHHVLRAEEHHRMTGGGPPEWNAIVVDAPHREPYVDAIVDQVRRELGGPRVSALVAARQRVAVLVPCAPRMDVVAGLHAVWPTVGVVFLSTVGGGGEAVRVVPGPCSDDEARADEEYQVASNRIRKRRAS